MCNVYKSILSSIEVGTRAGFESFEVLLEMVIQAPKRNPDKGWKAQMPKLEIFRLKMTMA